MRCKAKTRIQQRDWLAEKFASSSTSHVAEFLFSLRIARTNSPSGKRATGPFSRYGFGGINLPVKLVRQLEADILSISRGNSILVLSCFFKVSKCIPECWPRCNYLWALANTFFVNITIKLYYCEKRWYFKFNLRMNVLHRQKAHEKLNIRHLNGLLDFQAVFKLLILQTTKKC